MKNGVILIKELPAEKSQSSFGGLRSSSKPVNVLKGELLIAIPGDKLVPRNDGGKPHNYQLARDTNVSLRAEADENAPLSPREFTLLEAVKAPHTRYTIFISVGKIDWALSLRKGGEVYVLVNPQAHPSAWVYSKAVVRWFGELKDQRGTFFGVEIMEELFRGHGTTDGTFQGKRYFHCEDGCGFFVSLDKLSRHRDGSDLAAVPPSGMRYEGQSHDQSKSQSQPSQQSQQARKKHQSCQLKVLDSEQSTELWFLKEEINIDDQKEELKRLERENNERKRAQIEQSEIQQAGSSPRAKGNRPSSAEVPGVPSGHSAKFVHSVSDASYNRGNSQHPPEYDHQLAITSQPHHDPQHLQPTRQGPVRQQSVDHHYEEVDKLKPGHPASVSESSQGSGFPVPFRQYPRDQHEDIHQSQLYDHNHGRQLNSQLYPSDSQPSQSPYLASQQLQAGNGQEMAGQPQASHSYYASHSVLGESRPLAIAPGFQGNDAAVSLGIGSMVQVSDPPHYGVLRWIGNLSDIPGTIAGVELEEGMNGCSDGSRNGVKYFDCKPGRGLFCPLASLRPNERFTIPGETPGAAVVQNPLHKWPLQESLDQPFEDIDVSKYIGEERGIQGHQNSCYLDAIVFGLFAVSDVFDSMFLKDASDPAVKEISEILWKRIVNPLRKYGVVRYESVMALRNKLEEIGKMKGVNQDEKDPEEFLNILFKHALHVEPFITIRRPFGVEQEYFVQLFLEFDEKVKLPSVGFLLRKMFREQSISFTEAPPKLLIQVPRFGKKFKTYEKIVPDKNLDVGALLPSPYKCFICEESAWKKCIYCTLEFKSENSVDGVYFCDTCCDKVHSLEGRCNHQVELATAPTNYLQLLSVICIETGHYVCFAHTEGRWIFMDSMANRVYDMYYIPKGVDCTQDLNEWVYTQDWSQLSSTPPRELPEYVQQFTQDIYMCVYINPDAAMYGGGLGIAEPVTSQLSHPHELSQPEGHRSRQKEQDLQMKLQQSRQKEQDLQMELQQSRQKEQDLQMELQQLRQKEQDLQIKLQQTEQDLQTQLQQSQQKEQDQQRLLAQSRQTGQDHQRQLAQSRQTEQDLQRQLQLTTKAMQDLQLQSHSQASSRELEFWNVPRSDIRVVSEIGRGGWGTVLKGTFHGRAIAVKQLHPNILSKENIQRLRREVRMMAQVRHPNLLLFIAAVFDDEVERLRSPPLIVMELLDTDLRKAYQAKLILSRDRIPIFRDVAFALNYLHNCREPIIHRDLSAPNVLLEALTNSRWKAKVSDFGSANLAKVAQTAAEGAIIYCAPETLPDELRGPNPPQIPQTPKIDVYSYGVLLCEVIACKQPDQLSQLKAEVQQSWPLMHSLISSCTNYYPDDRPTIAQVLQELQKLP